MAVIEQALATERNADRQAIGFRERLDIGHRLVVPAAAAQHQERPFRRCQHVAQLRHVVRPRMRLDLGVPAGRRGDDAIAQHILGQRQDHRAGASRCRHVKGVADMLGDALGVVDLGNPLRHLAEHAPVVDFLERLAFDQAAPDLADEQDHRRRILESDVHAGAGVGGAGSARDEADAGLAGHLAVGFGHDGGAAFLAADHQVDFRGVVQRVQHGEEALARHGEGAPGAVRLQAVDQDFAAAAPVVLRVRHGRSFRPPWRRIRKAGSSCPT